MCFVGSLCLVRGQTCVGCGNTYLDKSSIILVFKSISIRLCVRRKVAHLSPHCSLCKISLCHIVYV